VFLTSFLVPWDIELLWAFSRRSNFLIQVLQTLAVFSILRTAKKLHVFIGLYTAKSERCWPLQEFEEKLGEKTGNKICTITRICYNAGKFDLIQKRRVVIFEDLRAPIVVGN
jgi:hypothetical protein